MSGTLDEALTREAAGQSRLLSSADLREGIAAWTERRKARFSGK
jgi:hypothetical protein